MKKFLIVVLVIIVAAFVAILALPGTYALEESIEIAASPSAVYNAAINVARWNMLGMMGMMGSMPSVPKGQMQMPKEMQDKMPGGMDPSSMMEGMQKVQKAMSSVKLKVKSSTAPGKIVFKMEGGPMDGMEPEMTIEKSTEKSSRVTIRESYKFEGFFAGIKAISAKMGSKKLNATSLQNLKKACEGTK